VHPTSLRKCLIDTGALHGSYVGSCIRAMNLKGLMGDDNYIINSPISNACTPSTYSVVALLSVFDVDKINKVVFETKLNILSSLDGREYDLIIGLPDFIKHNLLYKLRNQFGSFVNTLAHLYDRDNESSLRVLQSVSSSETFTAILFRISSRTYPRVVVIRVSEGGWPSSR